MNDMLPFNVPLFCGEELKYIQQACDAHRISGDGMFTQKCRSWLESQPGRDGKPAGHSALLTTSCTHASDMAAILCDIQPDDEVIMPSYTFVSTANSFVLRGGVPVFVDVRPDTMNMDEKLIEAAITPRTKAIAVVHYAGVACEMDTIMAIARAHGLLVVEDAAQGVMSTYKGQALGTIGDYGCYSFHETKNYSMGEGGALLIRDSANLERAEIIREKGTNRSKFYRGQIDKYTWVDQGSSYLPSELNAAYLWAQLEKADEINANRLASWNRYYTGLADLAAKERIQVPYVPPECGHNAHMFYIKCKDLDERTRLIEHLRDNDIGAVFHYVPLHSSPAGRRFGRFCGIDKYTTKDSERLLRLPMYCKLAEADVDWVIECICAFYRAM